MSISNDKSSSFPLTLSFSLELLRIYYYEFLNICKAIYKISDYLSNLATKIRVPSTFTTLTLVF